MLNDYVKNLYVLPSWIGLILENLILARKVFIAINGVETANIVDNETGEIYIIGLVRCGENYFCSSYDVDFIKKYQKIIDIFTMK
jgi:hypothetical protein